MARPLESTIGTVASVWPQANRPGSGKRPLFDEPGKVVCRSTCSHCSEFDVEGPVEETTKLFREHLAEAHPDFEPPTPRRNRRRR